MASKKSKNTGLVVILLMLSIAGGVVLGAYVVTTPNALHVPIDMRREKPVAAHKETQGPTDRLVPIVDKDGVAHFEHQKVNIPKGVDPKVFLLNDYLEELHSRGLGDKNARALGVDVHDRIAYVDFNRAFEQTYGTMDEGNVLRGIESVLGQFPEIDKVAFYIEGKPMETTGNVDLTQPQDVIRPDQANNQPTATAA